MVVINRIYIENYKLFTHKEIDFRDAMLSVFDGPNGYGKTSIFDAIELLITGEISRIKECDAIDGKLAYETVFLAKNPKKDIIIKGEFVDKLKGDTLILGARINANNLVGKHNNPKNIFDSIEYFCLPSYELSTESWTNYLSDKEVLNATRISFFGGNNIGKFTLFHYIRQEDRLAYFKQNEKLRSSTIESLLGIENERNRHKKIKATYKEISGRLKNVESQESGLKERLARKPEEAKRVEYISIFDGKFPWDMEKIKFDNTNSEQLLSQFYRELEGLESYVTNKRFHKAFFALEKYKLVPESLKKDTVHAWILLHNFPINFNSIELLYDELLFLKKQKQLIDAQDYTSVDFLKMCEKLGLAECGKKLCNEVTVLKEISLSQNEIQKTINNLLLIRENLHKEHQILGKDTRCPYCGYDWKDIYKLEEGYTEAENVLKSFLQRDGEKYNAQVSLIKQYIKEKCNPILIEKISNLSNKDVLTICGKFDNKSKFRNAILNCSDVMELIYDKVSGSEKKYESSMMQAEIALLMIANLNKELTEDYLEANEKYNYKDIKSRYNLDENVLEKISIKTLEIKKQYILSQFYESFNDLQKEIDSLEKQKDILTEMKSQLKEYASVVEKAIENYKKQVISEIEVPFFVYSSRLLQSYQGGQGVLIENDGETIRFNAPGSEHDILYTMSSGQLSAVLLSFSLAMNKIYAGEGIKTMFIDDPIQCMDDINMISFVELLRREFSDCQIILSTHEEDFSNFIRYKFDKYGLKTKAITLKET